MITVDFTSRTAKNVLTVPIAALLALSEGGYGVQVVSGDTSRIVAVSTGLFAQDRVEISGTGLAPGQLVGVPTAGATVPSPSGESGGGSIGLGFAIPVDLAKSIADEIIATGRVTHAFFGVQTTPIPPAAAAQAGVPEGLFVQAVSPGGPAATAGLRPDDVITTINGEPATSNIQLEELTLTKKPGDTVSIGYNRAGHSAKATVTLAAQP